MKARQLSSIFAIAILVCPTACSNSKSISVPSTPLPKVVVDSNEIDFGKIEFGESRAMRQIAIRNGGGQLLKLHEIALSCNCLAAKPLKDMVDPGDQTAIQIAIDRRRLGPQQADITIRSNDLENPALRIHFKWLCCKRVEFTPSAIDFEMLKPGERAEKLIQLSGAESLEAELVIGERNASTISILPEEGNSKYAIVLEAPEISGQYYDELRLISKAGESLAVLPIRWSVVCPVEVAPRFVLLRAGPERGQWIAELNTTVISASSRLNVKSVTSKADISIDRFEVGRLNEQGVASLTVYLSAIDENAAISTMLNIVVVADGKEFTKEVEVVSP